MAHHGSLTNWKAKDGCYEQDPNTWKPLTFWRAKDRCEQGPNTVHHGSHSLPGEPRTGVVGRVQIQLTTEATHILESQGQVLSAEIQLTMEATHFLESQGQVLLAGSKCGPTQRPLTTWRAKDRHCEQGSNPAHHRSHSQPEEPRTGIVSRVQIQLTTEATHKLKSQDRCHEQGSNPAHHGSHSHPGEPRTGAMSRVQIQLTTEATHKLKSQGQALSAGSKYGSPQKPPTNWRAKDRHCQQG